VGRILDSNNKPVAGARVHVRDLVRDSRQPTADLRRGENRESYPGTWRGSLPGQPGVTTGVDGRFRLSGLGSDRLVLLAGGGPGSAESFLTAAVRPPSAAPAGGGAYGPNFDFVAAPARLFRGVVRDKETGSPVPGVKMSVYPSTFSTVTDSDGRFEIV